MDAYMPCLRTKLKIAVVAWRVLHAVGISMLDDGCEGFISLYNVMVNNRWSFAKNIQVYLSDLLTMYNTPAATVALVFTSNNQYKYTYSQNY